MILKGFNENMSCGIYCIENLINGKKYIGQGIDVEYRMNKYHKGCYALNNAIKLYGKENFIKYVIKYCEKEELNSLEKYYILKFHSHISDNGYNISWDNAPMRKRKHTSEAKEKIREANLGEKNPNYGKKGEKNPIFGTIRPLSTREKMRNSKLGKPRSAETKEKISNSRLGKHYPRNH